MKPGWTKGKYRINTGDGFEEVAGYVRGCFGVRKHFTRYVQTIEGRLYKRITHKDLDFEFTI